MIHDGYENDFRADSIYVPTETWKDPEKLGATEDTIGSDASSKEKERRAAPSLEASGCIASPYGNSHEPVARCLESLKVNEVTL